MEPNKTKEKAWATLYIPFTKDILAGRINIVLNGGGGGPDGSYPVGSFFRDC